MNSESNVRNLLSLYCKCVYYSNTVYFIKTRGGSKLGQTHIKGAGIEPLSETNMCAAQTFMTLCFALASIFCGTLATQTRPLKDRDLNLCLIIDRDHQYSMTALFISESLNGVVSYGSPPLFRRQVRDLHPIKEKRKGNKNEILTDLQCILL